MTAVLERDQALELVETLADVHDRAAIDAVIAARVAAGRPFTVNDCRHELDGVRPALIGARFMAAARRGEIVPDGYVPSTSPATHAAPVRRWLPARVVVA